jgi:hypothetical protein
MNIKCLVLKRKDGLETICPVKFNCHEHKSATKEDIQIQPADEIRENGCRKFKSINNNFKAVKK